MNSLHNKIIVITGASSGIGRQIAIEASLHEAGTILIARNKTRLEETHQMLTGGNHWVCPFDVTDFARIEQFVEEIYNKAGVISGFVHCAGLESTIPFRNMNPEIYNNLFNTNVIAGLEFARIISKKKFINPQGGSFIFLGSVMSRFGKEGKVGYCASKGALTSSIKAMALELSSRKIRCNVILPGIVKTEMVDSMFESLPESSVNQIASQHPLGLGIPEDIASLAVFLLSDNSRWITGSEIVIDGGYSAQ
ncbi:MAG TPA: SDR family oxidoreductase [Bacteroidales bacterium]|nr:SDR family oxidoreductase [Bacteroidales bacterium]